VASSRNVLALAQTGTLLCDFGGLKIWDYFENRYPDSESHRWFWFRKAWSALHPIGIVVEAPDAAHLVMTNGSAATTWKIPECTPTGLSLSVAHVTSSPFAIGAARGSRE
jgi:hypothetical protein